MMALLSPRELRQAYLLFAMAAISALLDVVGIASIMPFMALLADQNIVYSNRWLNSVYTGLGFGDPERFLFFLGFVVFVAMLVSIAFKAATTWTIQRFGKMRNYSISRRLVAGYLAQDYQWFLNRNSAELGKATLSEVQQVVDTGLVSVISGLAQTTVIIAILLLLISIDPKLALFAGGAIGGAYLIIFLTFRGLLNRAGRDRLAANEGRFKAVNEAFVGIKDVKLGGHESAALRRFDSAARRFARAQVLAAAIGMLPKYVLEIIAFGGILSLVLLLMGRGQGLEKVLPIISVYALAGYRLMPAFQGVYKQITSLRFAAPAIEPLHRDLIEYRSHNPPDSSSGQVLLPRQAIFLDDVTYTYPGAEFPALQSLSLKVPARATVGLVGQTGSGKTTAVDIILGLLQPQLGCLRVDDEKITRKNLRDWQRVLGYVPQQIFLSDDSVAANIAFGVREEQIDRLAVERAAKIANLHTFVVDALPDGYDTVVGERGIRLSGGQRQRIGIARALYNNPKVIVLDEATSALDNLTEQAVMEAVHNLGGKVTVILIAHRLTTVKECDHIYLLDRGKLVGEGTYEELRATHARFRAMAGSDVVDDR